MRTAAYLLVALCATAVLVSAAKYNELNNYSFDIYVKEHNKHYADASETEFRRSVFNKNLRMVQHHNANPDRLYNKGINHLSDLTADEMKRLFGNNKKERRQSLKNAKTHKFPSRNVSLPYSVDWRKEGVVSTVKNQGSCGSCWAHSMISTLESLAAINTGKLFTLSTQQIVSCAPSVGQCGGTGGCQGSTAESGFEYVSNSNGVAEEWSYPYESYNGANITCKFDKALTPPVVKADGYVKLDTNDYDLLMQAVATVGPIAISVDASNWGSYESGIFDGCDFNKNIDIDHAVVLVGYGTEFIAGKGNVDYWIVRNSWSPVYGENGYIRVLRTSTTACGTDTTPGDGTGCPGGPTTVTVCGMCGILSDSCFPVNARLASSP